MVLIFFLFQVSSWKNIFFRAENSYLKFFLFPVAGVSGIIIIVHFGTNKSTFLCFTEDFFQKGTKEMEYQTFAEERP